MVTCPNPNCARDIPVEVDVNKAAITDAGGLFPIRCSHCGHAGFMIGEGLHLVFRAGQEFCFTLGTTPAQLTMLIPAQAMYAYQWLGLSQEALARHAAEWLLLLGHKAGRFTLSPDQSKFAGFMRYVEDKVPRFRPHVA